MKQENVDLYNNDADTQLDKNFSRLLKLTGKSNKPSRAFSNSLIETALNELNQLNVDTTGSKNIAIRSNLLERIIGWAAMIAVACGAGFVVMVSFFLKMNLLIEIIVVLTMVFNWINYPGGKI